jgi:hypothetical protein
MRADGRVPNVAPFLYADSIGRECSAICGKGDHTRVNIGVSSDYVLHGFSRRPSAPHQAQDLVVQTDAGRANRVRHAVTGNEADASVGRRELAERLRTIWTARHEPRDPGFRNCAGNAIEAASKQTLAPSALNLDPLHASCGGYDYEAHEPADRAVSDRLDSGKGPDDRPPGFRTECGDADRHDATQ